jgi:hypothetical protein
MPSSSGRLITAISTLPPNTVTYIPTMVSAVAPVATTIGSHGRPPRMNNSTGTTYRAGMATPSGVIVSSQKMIPDSRSAPSRSQRGCRLTGGVCDPLSAGSLMRRS